MISLTKVKIRIANKSKRVGTTKCIDPFVIGEKIKQKVKRPNKKISTNKHKAKGLGQAFFPKGLRESGGQSHLVAARKQRNPFASGQSN